MSQVWTDIPSTLAVRDSRQIILDRFEALRTGFSGTSAPSSPATYQTYVNASTGKLQRYMGSGSGWVDEIDLTNVAGPTIANSTKLNGQSASYYTDIAARLGYTPFSNAGGTIAGATTVTGLLSANGSIQSSAGSFSLLRTGDTAGGTFIGGGTAATAASGAHISLYGATHSTNGGALVLTAGDSATDGRIIFHTAGTQSFAINRTADLIANGQAFYRANNTGVLQVSGGNSTSSGAMISLFGGAHSTAAGRCVIAAAGGFFVQAVFDSTTASAANVFVTSGGNLLRSTSSKRYKEVLGDFDPEIARKILRVRRIYYRSRSRADRPDWTFYGMLAEELAQVDPRFVSFRLDPAGNQVLDDAGLPIAEGIQYDRLVVPLLALADLAEDRLEALSAIAAELGQRVARLEASVK